MEYFTSYSTTADQVKYFRGDKPNPTGCNISRNISRNIATSRRRQHRPQAAPHHPGKCARCNCICAAAVLSKQYAER